jgi:hypothetical protein
MPASGAGRQGIVGERGSSGWKEWLCHAPESACSHADSDIAQVAHLRHFEDLNVK